MKIAVIDYGAGNLQNVCNALEKIGKKYGVVTRLEELGRYSKVILPGVGAAGSAMQKLREIRCVDFLAALELPFLGICLGMQLLAEYSDEGDAKCLFAIPGRVRKLPATVKVPQIGWNKVSFVSDSLLTKDIPDDSYFYFVNSYYFDAPEKFIVAKTNYGLPIASIVYKNNFYGVQFHPEKSGENGLQLLRNFCEKC